jgi:uncharacterized membrane protein
MDPLLRTILRVIHVFGGVAWAGSTFLMVMVLAPAANETRPESAKVMGNVGPRFRNFATIAGLLSLVSGLWLYWFTSALAGGAFNVWIGGDQGIFLTLGAVGGLLSFIVGVVVAGPTTGKIVALGGEIAKGGGPPSPEQGAQMQKLQQTQGSAGNILAILFVITIIGMAAAGV